MEIFEHRVVNGLLKSHLSASTPEEVTNLLNRDLTIMAPDNRASELWPCIWALASALERQFTGTIYVECGLGESLPCPSPLGTRVEFVSELPAGALRIAIGDTRCEGGAISGDVSGSQISFGRTFHNGSGAHPISCFALAGYLGYAALAHAVDLPSFHEAFVTDTLTIPIPQPTRGVGNESFGFFGLGQLGQAYLSLLFFLDPRPQGLITLVDKDRFEKPNRSTQIMVDESGDWEGEFKAKYLESKLTSLGWNVRAEISEIAWGWKRPTDHAAKAVLGFDNFDARRVVINSDYEWIFEAGIGTSFLQPRVTWHSFPPEKEFKNIFPPDAVRIPPDVPTTPFGKLLLKDTPGGCGWVTFNNISASAPSIGIVASSYLWCEILRGSAGKQPPVSGLAHVWSPLLPFLTEVIQSSS